MISHVGEEPGAISRKVLIPLDGSGRAEAVLSLILPLLHRVGASAVLFTAVRTWTEHSSPSWEMTEEMRRAALEEGKAYLSHLSELFTQGGIQTSSAIAEAPAAEAILEAGDRLGVSLLALTTHGRTGLSRWILGSVAEKVIRTSPVPVLVFRSFQGVHPDAVPAGPREWSPRKVLVALDGSALSQASLPPALEMARLFRAEVVIVHVREIGHADFSSAQWTRAEEECKRTGIEAKRLLLYGDPAGGILEACEREGADLIALSTHGRSGISRWMLGSVTERVLRAATVPLLVVRPLKTGYSASS